MIGRLGNSSTTHRGRLIARLLAEVAEVVDVETAVVSPARPAAVSPAVSAVVSAAVSAVCMY